MIKFVNRQLLNYICLVNTPILIFHGLGSNAEDMKQLICEILPREYFANTKIICPNAQIKNVSLMFGMPTTAWCDVSSTNKDGNDNFDDMNATAVDMTAIIAEELQDNENLSIIIGGFSQGAALAYHLLITIPISIKACIILSGWVPARNNKLFDAASGVNNNTAILHCHGKYDNIVPYMLEYKQILIDNNYNNVRFELYECNHNVNEKEIEDIRAFVIKCLVQHV